MSDAPERIWATGDGQNGSWTHVSPSREWQTGAQEFVHADLYTTLRLELLSALGDAGANLDRAVKVEAERDAALAQVERMRGSLPRLTKAMIHAAGCAHYGEENFVQSGGISGVTLTSAEVDYNFEQAFRRMWRGIRALTLEETAP